MSFEKFHHKMLQYFKSLLTVYTTTRLVKIRSTFLAVVYIVIVVFMWCTFILGWLHLDVKKAYQKSCPVRGVVSAKVKGFASTEDLSYYDLGTSIPNPELYKRIWDFVDLVSPPFGGEGEYTGFTVATNFVITTNQTRSKCPGEPVSRNKCTRDEDCTSKNRTWNPSGQGIYTGKCNNSLGFCEVSGWCPLENDAILQLPFQGRQALLQDVQNFTVLIKNSVGFPGCGDHKGQNIRSKDGYNLRDCIHHPETQPKCPIFRIGDIVKYSGENFSDVAILGGVFKVEINWICDFDFGKSIDQCEPRYSFLRVDDRKFVVSKGWNYRFADYHEENRRTLHKVYGLQILVSTVGEGRKFDFFEGIISLGAMVGLFAVASLTCDFLFDILCLLNSLHCQAMKNYTQDIRFGGDEEFDLPMSSRVLPASENKKLFASDKENNVTGRLDSNLSPKGSSTNIEMRDQLLPETITSEQ